MAAPVPLQKPKHTYDAKDTVRDFHRDLPSDRRYNSTTVEEFTPTVAVTQDPDRRNAIVFKIPPNTIGGYLHGSGHGTNGESYLAKTI